MKHAVYAGTFDPFTKGHEHILKQAIPLFDRITLAIGLNPTKKTLLDLDSRIDLLNDVCYGLDSMLQVSQFENMYLVNYAASIGADYVIRGLRNSSDFEYEYTMAQINQEINPLVRTVFFMADPQYAAISSSMVKGLIGPHGWQLVVREYIPYQSWDRLIQLLDTTPNI